jgi:hypothetical protein
MHGATIKIHQKTLTISIMVMVVEMPVRMTSVTILGMRTAREDEDTLIDCTNV